MRILILTLCLWLHLGATADTLKVFGDDRYAPLVYLQDGRPAGTLVELLRRAEKLTGDRYELELMAWKRAVSLAQRGEGGVIGVSWTQERAQWLDYSVPIYDDAIQILVRKGKGFKFSSLEDLRGKTLGGSAGASYGEAVDAAIAAGQIKVERDWGPERRLRILLAERIDGALIGNGSAGVEALFAQAPELGELRSQTELLPRPLTHDRLHLSFPKSLRAQAALERFNRAAKELGYALP